MGLCDNSYFNSLSKAHGQFYATLVIAKSALEVCKQLPGRIEVSTAIDYVASGKSINPEDFPNHRLDVAKDYTLYILDEEVRTAILVSYEKSLACDNLVYDYQSITDEPRQQRVRIVTRILWDRHLH